MNETRAILLVFALLGSVVFPVAIACHSHHYGDGSYFFLTMLETGKIASTGASVARIGHHLLTQGPVILADHVGLNNVVYLSWLYGFILYYLPWLLFAVACALFLRANMMLHALLTAMLYLLLLSFTSFFIISESHLAVSLFILSLTIILTCSLHKWPIRLALLCLWLASLSVYEFSAIYFSVLLAALAVQCRAGGSSHFFKLLGPLYVMGALLNAYSILVSPMSTNRDAMFGVHLASVWPLTLFASLLFSLAVLAGLYAQPLEKDSCLLVNRVLQANRFAWLRTHAIALIQIGIGVLTVLGCALVLHDRLACPWNAYQLRILNIVLPACFVIFVLLYFVFARKRKLIGGNPIVIAGVLSMLILAACTFLHHSLAFNSFQRRLSQVVGSSSGFVAVSDVFQVEKYGWVWTYPTMSILSQVLHDLPIQTIVYNPHAEPEPFGPADFRHLKRLTSRLGLTLDDELLLANQAAEITICPRGRP
jgi:hypothetical protein